VDSVSVVSAVVDRSPGPGNGYLTAFLVRGTPDEAEYARRSTVFVLAEYLAWAEVLRRDIQFLNLGSSRVNRKVMGQVSRVSADISQISATGNELRLFRAQQRAIGELMVHPDSAPGQRWCLGYAEFCQRLDQDDAFRAWFAGLRRSARGGSGSGRAAASADPERTGGADRPAGPQDRAVPAVQAGVRQGHPCGSGADLRGPVPALTHPTARSRRWAQQARRSSAWLSGSPTGRPRSDSMRSRRW